MKPSALSQKIIDSAETIGRESGILTLCAPLILAACSQFCSEKTQNWIAGLFRFINLAVIFSEFGHRICLPEGEV